MHTYSSGGGGGGDSTLTPTVFGRGMPTGGGGILEQVSEKLEYVVRTLIEMEPWPAEVQVEVSIKHGASIRLTANHATTISPPINASLTATHEGFHHHIPCQLRVATLHRLPSDRSQVHHHSTCADHRLLSQTHVATHHRLLSHLCVPLRGSLRFRPRFLY